MNIILIDMSWLNSLPRFQTEDSTWILYNFQSSKLHRRTLVAKVHHKLMGRSIAVYNFRYEPLHGTPADMHEY